MSNTDDLARIKKLESLYTKIKQRTEKTVVSDIEPESPTLGLQWFDTTSLAFKIWGGRDWETTTVKSLTVGTTPNWFRVDENGNMWSGRDTLALAQANTFAVLNTGVLYAKNANISGSITITAGSSGYSNLSDKPALGSLAYDDLVELAKLGSTIIVGGYIKTSLLTADNIVTGSLTGRTVQTATTGARIELTSTNGLRSFDSGDNVRLRMPTDGTGITFFTSTGISTNRLQGGVIGSGAWAGKRVLNVDNNGVSGDGNLLVDNDCGIIGTLWASGKMRLPVGTNLY